MKTYQVETLSMSEARTLCGARFVITEKDQAKSEDGLITLLTRSEEGFTHVLGEARFIYQETKKEHGEDNEVVWVAGLFSENNNNVLMVQKGEGKNTPLDLLLISNVRKLINFPNSTGQYIRFGYRGGCWELVFKSNLRSMTFLLRRVLVGSKHADYFPVFEYERWTHFNGVYSVAEQFKHQLNEFYSPE